jgi:hypothetical protein
MYWTYVHRERERGVDGVRFRLDLTPNEKIQKFHAFKISQAGLNASHLATFGETFSRVYVGIRNDVPPTYLALAKRQPQPTQRRKRNFPLIIIFSNAHIKHVNFSVNLLQQQQHYLSSWILQ